METTLDVVALHLLFLERPAKLHQLLYQCGNLYQLLHAPRTELPQLTDPQWTALQGLRQTVDYGHAQRVWDQCRRCGVQVVTYQEPGYPPQLREIPDCPMVLFVRGTLAALHESPLLAIVGTRKATPYGRAQTEAITRGLVERGVTIVSGLAFGIDAVAHRTALECGAQTIGVLASGVDEITPRTHYHLGNDVVAQGALCSEYLPGTPSEAHRYPQRNRLISGLCAGVLVVEAEVASGTMWTAKHAMEQGRLVFAVPGTLDRWSAAGPHHLIRQGAILVESAEQIYEAIVRQYPTLEATTGQQTERNAKGLSAV